MNGDIIRLRHILLAIEEIASYTQGVNLEQFSSSSLIFSACVRQVAIIGEASARLSETLRNQHPEVPWKTIIGMRNIIIHNYFGVSIQFVWSTIENDLPILKTQIETILQDLN